MGRLKVQKSWHLRVRCSPFFQAFKWEIAVCPCLLAGIPLGETRSGKASPRLVTFNQSQISNTHAHSGVPQFLCDRKAGCQYASRKVVGTLPEAVEEDYEDPNHV